MATFILLLIVFFCLKAFLLGSKNILAVASVKFYQADWLFMAYLFVASTTFVYRLLSPLSSFSLALCLLLHTWVFCRCISPARLIC